MRYRWGDIPTLLRTPIGRTQFLSGVYYRAWPILSRIASLHRQMLARKTRIVAVVGSFGKTTTARAIATALGGQIRPHIELNEWSFVAHAVLRIRPHDRHAVIEVGIDGAGQMAAYAGMIRPDISVVTSIGSEHHRSLGTLEVTRAEKADMVRILPKSGIAVLNGDDPNVRWMKKHTRARVITFGIDDTSDIRASDVALDWPHGTRLRLKADGATRDLHIQLIGRHMVYPILAAIGVGLAEGFTLDQILPALESLAPTPGCLEPTRLANGAFILGDYFKSTLETIETALDVFSEIPAKRRIIVLGEVSEPPGSQGPIYRHIGKRIGKIASGAIFVGGNFQRYAAGAARGGLPRSALMNAGRSVLKAAEVLQGDLRPGDVMLIKGRDTQRLDRVALALKGRRVRCDISFCNAMPTRCKHCPMLERGWNGLRVVI